MVVATYAPPHAYVPAVTYAVTYTLDTFTLAPWSTPVNGSDTSTHVDEISCSDATDTTSLNDGGGHFEVGPYLSR